MIKSMTGYCKVETELEGRLCSVEMRSVNHRYLEAKVFLPKSFAVLEEGLKKQLRTHLSRGKVDVSLSLGAKNEEQDRLSVDSTVMNNLKTIVGQFETNLGQSVSVSLNDLMQVKGLIKYGVLEDTFDYPALFAQAITKGAQALCEMRETEGRLLFQVLNGHLGKLTELIQQVGALTEQAEGLVKKRLARSLVKLGLELNLDDPRVMQEVGFQMDRADITEEVQRFETHLTHFRQILADEEPVGRKLDFLTQEMNREANTLCSKSGHSAITELGVNLKTELEKLREQIQNIE